MAVTKVSIDPPKHSFRCKMPTKAGTMTLNQPNHRPLVRRVGSSTILIVVAAMICGKSSPAQAFGGASDVSGVTTTRQHGAKSWSAITTHRQGNLAFANRRPHAAAASTLLRMSPGDPPPPGEYSRDVRLREEAESPFRKVRFFFYTACLAGALTSLAVSAARIAAGLSGINRDLLEQSSVNAGVDVVAIAVLSFLYKRDLEAQESRLKRASKGKELAGLAVRGSPTLLLGEGSATGGVPSAVAALSPGGRDGSSSSSTSSPPMVTATLSSLRRGRGVEKRVIIAAGGKGAIQNALEDARRLSASLLQNDLLIVPVVLPQCGAPLGLDPDLIEQDCVALPAGGNWNAVVGDEADQARDQGVDVEGDGFCVVLKKNGRVGQRTKGINLGRFVGEVEQRKEMGLDVKNI